MVKNFVFSITSYLLNFPTSRYKEVDLSSHLLNSSTSYYRVGPDSQLLNFSTSFLKREIV